MKKLLILLLLIVLVPSLNFAANEGVGILFDNSGSMRNYFTKKMLEDAEKVVMDLVFNGTYDRKTWSMVAQGDEYTKRSNRKLWQPDDMIYVHAFGQIIKPTEPFFRVNPEYGEQNTENEAREFIRKELFDKLNYKDNKTNYELAQDLCWLNLCNQLGSGGKDYYMNVLIISDFEPDHQPEFAGSGDAIHKAIINNNVAEGKIFWLKHNTPGEKYPNVKLQILILHIGPHFIQKPPPTPTPGPGKTPIPSKDKDQIILKTPKPNYELNPKKEPNIKFSWKAKGNFEKYIVEIHSLKPRRKVLVRETKNKQTLVPAKILTARMNSFKSDRLVWFVKGVYPKETKKLSMTSNRYFLKEASGGGSAIWILLLILLLIAGMIFALPKIIEKVKSRPKGETGGGEGEVGKTVEEVEDDWSKDL
jgi:hypothetical protein